MKKLIIIATVLFSVNVFAAGTIDCTAEDGSSIKGIVNNQQGSVPTQVEYSVRGSSFKPATVINYISTKAFANGSVEEEQVQTIAIIDSETGELATVVTNGSLIDKTGAYSVTCSFGY